MPDDNKKTVYWLLLDHKNWHLYIAATTAGLCYVGSPDAPFEEMAAWVDKHLSHYELLEDADTMGSYEKELVEYLTGRRKKFTIPLDLRGTEFQRKVWQELMRVPYGATATYTEIAQRIGREDAVRAVGTAIGANPVLIPVPCHRMLGKHGEWRGYRGGLDMKRRLLEIEQ